MAYSTDTHTLSLDRPVPEGIAKVLRENAPWDTDLSQETSDITCFQEEEDSIQLKPTLFSDKPLGFTEWLGVAAARLSRTFVTTLAATQLNLAQLSSDPQVTVAFDTTAILKAISAERASVVAVSAALVAPRSEVRASSLLAPSGGYLAWMEMLQESPDVAEE
ncbi:MAG: hypothetical protein ACYSWW_10845 [Planctomycetota bacterium]|jgi:hypothetical protein